MGQVYPRRAGATGSLFAAIFLWSSLRHMEDSRCLTVSSPPLRFLFVNAPCIPSGLCSSQFAAMFLWSSLRNFTSLDVPSPAEWYLEKKKGGH